jgi:hypothetical protein
MQVHPMLFPNFLPFQIVHPPHPSSAYLNVHRHLLVSAAEMGMWVQLVW